jgi:GT2 family glycosyltransferase
MITFSPVAEPDASILITAWRAAPYLFDCLKSIQDGVRDVAYEVVIVLNDPTDALAAKVRAEVVGAVVVRSQVNIGFAGAANLGAAHARGRNLVLLNDDAVVEPGWLNALIEMADRRPGAGVVGSRICDLDGTIQEDGAVVWSDGSTTNIGHGLSPSESSYRFERQIDYCSGCSMLVRRDLWDAIGGMSDNYFPAYYEDVDFCFRAYEAGSTVWHQPASVVRHRRSASTSGPYRSFLMERNKRTFTRVWNDALTRRASPSVGDPPAIDRAVWRAMGSPARILVVVDGLPQSIEGTIAAVTEAWAFVGGTGGYHLTLASTRPWCSEKFHAEVARAGVEVVVAEPAAHLARRGVAYTLALLATASSPVWVDQLRSQMPTTQVCEVHGGVNFHRKFAIVHTSGQLPHSSEASPSPTSKGAAMWPDGDADDDVSASGDLDSADVDVAIPPALGRLLQGESLDEPSRSDLLSEVRLSVLYRKDLERRLVIVNDQIAEKNEYILEIEARLDALTVEQEAFKRVLLDRRSQIDERE